MEFVESPNKSKRLRPINMIVIHATAGDSLAGAIDWMTNPESAVSAHYCIDRNGDCVELVKDEEKAWHAGVSAWFGERDLNENSIGIELVNLNDGKEEYPDVQIIRLATLVCALILKFPAITEDRILGHCKIAPGRKTDPGILFPWVKFGSLLQYERNKTKET